jgi:hypothetical protein
MRLLRLLSFGALSVVLSGCINAATLVKVKPDGSGTVEQTVLMNMAALKGMMSSLDPKGQMKGESPFSEAQLKQTAEKLGKGVKFVSSTPMKGANGFEGVKAIFSFEDINQIRVDQDPNIAGGTGGAMSQGSSANPVRFKFEKQGANSLLTIQFDENTKAGNPDPAPSTQAPTDVDPAMMQMMKQMFNGFKVAIDLEVEGKIVKTNADYVSGSKITLLELDMAGLFEDEAKFKALQSKIKPGASIAEVKPYLKDVKGVKINNPTVSILFR